MSEAEEVTDPVDLVRYIRQDLERWRDEAQKFAVILGKIKKHCDHQHQEGVGQVCLCLRCLEKRAILHIINYNLK